eukprot:1597961-Rhodomonas_salina.3
MLAFQKSELRRRKVRHSATAPGTAHGSLSQCRHTCETDEPRPNPNPSAPQLHPQAATVGTVSPQPPPPDAKL